jgi:hypothetical protein
MANVENLRCSLARSSRQYSWNEANCFLFVLSTPGNCECAGLQVARYSAECAGNMRPFNRLGEAMATRAAVDQNKSSAGCGHELIEIERCNGIAN